ncbi:hypothetical protein [Streptomyces violascens]|uniref:hypothetical protein n=1 Tax=Streptomyces violascens TaxID=67381 RepID=UPI00365E2094
MALREAAHTGERDLSFLGETGFAPTMPTGYPRSTSDGANWSNSSNWAEANAYWNNFTGDPTASYDPSTRAVDFAGPLSPPRLGARRQHPWLPDHGRRHGRRQASHVRNTRLICSARST